MDQALRRSAGKMAKRFVENIEKRRVCQRGEAEGVGSRSDLERGSALIELKRACVMNHNILTYLVDVLTV